MPRGTLATSLTLKSETPLEDGVLLRKYRTGSPSTDLWVLVIDLHPGRPRCGDGTSDEGEA